MRGAANELFAQTKPLRDPVRSSVIFVLCNTAVTAFLTILIAWSTLQFAWGAMPELMVQAVFNFAILLPFPFAIWLLLRRSLKRKVIFLRSFRGDRSAVWLRRLLAVALGKNHRLCGIRQPKARASFFMRAFMPVVTALRYVNSPKLDLEAEDSDWMARLLASYAQCRFAIVDIRDLTPHVLNEIRLSFHAFGAERCVFLVDSSQPPMEWHRKIAEILEVPEREAAEFHVLAYPGDTKVNPGNFVDEARRLFETIPQGAASIGTRALGFAGEHVPERAWRTRFSDTDLFAVLAAIVLTVSSSIVLYLFVSERWSNLARQVIGVVSLCCVYVFYYPAWIRTWRQITLSRRLTGSGRKTAGSRLGLLVSILIVSAPIPVIAAASYVTSKARRVRADAEIALLSAALESYKADNGAYPQKMGVTEKAPGAQQSPIDPRRDGNPEAGGYANASRFLYQELTGDMDFDGTPGDEGRAVYLRYLSPAMLKMDPSGRSVLHIQDPFGHPYGYSTEGARAEMDYLRALRSGADPNVTARPTAAGFNFYSFDLWSTGGSKTNPATDESRRKWLKNW
jgi:hypothetical protein